VLMPLHLYIRSRTSHYCVIDSVLDLFQPNVTYGGMTVEFASTFYSPNRSNPSKITFLSAQVSAGRVLRAVIGKTDYKGMASTRSHPPADTS
jgi:hypothetical protein